MAQLVTRVHSDDTVHRVKAYDDRELVIVTGSSDPLDIPGQELQDFLRAEGLIS